MADVFFAILLALFVPAQTPAGAAEASKPFRAGAATANVSPWFGLSMAGSFVDHKVSYVHDELHARALVLDNGSMRLVFVLVDSCMVLRETCDAAKSRIEQLTGIPPECVLIAATHSHSAPASASVFQSDPDPQYRQFLIERIGNAVGQATQNLAPARIGWGSGNLPGELHNRRWKMKPGTIPPNPFGATTDSVQMNPPVGSENLVEPAGPIDPEISYIAVQTLEGQPIAVLANYSLHYIGGVGGGHASADYFGYFAREIERLLQADPRGTPFVGMLSNGTSGDVNNVNFKTPVPPRAPYEQMQRVAKEVAAEVYRSYQTISFLDWVPLDIASQELELGVRKPAPDEVARARDILAQAAGRDLTSGQDVYARETVLINEWSDTTKFIVQTVRIGDLGIAAIPCEVFTEIGLAIKGNSAIKPCFTIELANGYNGYLPTAAQHALGGYETWRARSSYLEVNASDRIQETVLSLFDRLKQTK
jgi:neutral ceramidase